MYDLYYGTLAARIDTVIYQLDQLKADPDYQITELEEERLWFDGRTDEDLPPITPIYERFGRLYTAGIYATCIMDRFIG